MTRSLTSTENRIRKEVGGWLRVTYEKKSLRAEVEVDEDTLDEDSQYFWAYVYDGRKLVAEGEGWFEDETKAFDELEGELNARGYRRIPLSQLGRRSR
ncbi:MAG: hypothetical protein WCB19_05675 [Thermoplasmata archaeon]